MCGRFTLKIDPNTIYETLELGEMPQDLEPRYNIAPSQPVAVVTDPATRQVEMFRWGLIPFWAKDAAIANKLINARAETIAEKPAFRAAFAQRRCLVLADGFYEWQKRSKAQGGSQPYYFQLDSGDPFAFAGLWEQWRNPAGETVHSCTLVTCTANDLVSPIHERMPVMLGEDELWQWLQPDAPAETLYALLRPYPTTHMATYPVSSVVNSPHHDSPQCIEPLAA